MTAEELELCGDRLDSVRDLLELLPNEVGSWKYAYWYKVYQYLDEKLELLQLFPLSDDEACTFMSCLNPRIQNLLKEE